MKIDSPVKVDMAAVKAQSRVNLKRWIDGTPKLELILGKSWSG